MRYKVESPVKKFTGAVAGVHFVEGVADVDDTNSAAMAYFRRHGYTLTEHEDQPDEDKSEPKRADGPRVRNDGLPYGAPKADADEAEWRTYVHEVADRAGDAELAERSQSMTRDELVEHVKEQVK